MNQINENNQLGELILLKQRIEASIKNSLETEEKKKLAIKEGRTKQAITCSWCGNEIEDFEFYYCNTHKKAFCCFCATWGNPNKIRNSEWRRSEYGRMAPVCNKSLSTECILEKKEVFI